MESARRTSGKSTSLGDWVLGLESTAPITANPRRHLPGIAEELPQTRRNAPTFLTAGENLGVLAQRGKAYPRWALDQGVAKGESSSAVAPAVTVADGLTVEIDGAGTEPVTFVGTTGTLILDDALGFTGQVSGLAGSDAIDLADVSYGINTTAAFLGNADGGTLTISDGTQTANITLVGNYLSSSWDLASDGNGGTTVVDPTWQTLDVGAGGWITGLDIAPNGTMVARTDTYGAYIWNGTQWQQLITATSMPAAFTTQAAIVPMAGQQGVDEIQVAPSNSSILYMMYDGYVFESSNDGTTWTETSFAQVVSGSNDAYRMDGQRMVIDPNNPDVVYVGTPESGLFVTTNGGVTWESVSAVPVSTEVSGVYPGITGILFDPAVGGTTGGDTNTVFASSYGNGVYESTNAGATWTHLSGGPSNVEDAAVSSTGVYYAVGDGGTDFWSYANGTWTELLTPAVVGGNALQAVAIDPLNSSEIVVITDGGSLDISYNGGATWSGDNWSEGLSSSDIPWLTLAGTENQFMSVGGLEFSPTVPNELIASDGIGVWTTTIPTSSFASNTPVTWDDQSSGIEQLVAWQIVVPPGGDPVLASMDRGFFYIDNAAAYPSTYGPVMGVSTATGFSLDYASSDPSFMVGIAEWGVEQSGYSTNGGQTWTPFPTFIPGADTSFKGGTIAASTPTDIIWAPSSGNKPYYTLNGGETWNPITLPGVTSWSSFDSAWYLDTRTVTADRVLANTFYLYNPTYGVFETTNGGVAWTEVHTGSISPTAADDSWNSELQSVPGEAGNLFFTAGPLDGSQPDGVGFYRSTNQGATWTAVANVQEVYCFGYGAAAPGQSYPAIYIVGYVNGVFGVWQSINNAQSWSQIGTNPNNSIDSITTISGDPNVYGQVYVGFSGSGYAILTAPPSVTTVAASPSTGVESTGQTINITVNLTALVTVTGTPTLSLNDGGTATYVSGSGTNALTFSYTIGAGQNTSALAITAANLPNGATIRDDTGTSATLTGAVTSFPGLQITSTGTGPTSIVESPSSGDLDAGRSVTLTLNMSGNVTVNTTGGTPTLTLNDGSTATYSSGSGTSALVFSYTVAAGQNTAALAATAVNLNGATITDGSGNAANLSLTGLIQTGPQIDTTAPIMWSLAVSGPGITSGQGDLGVGKTVTFTIDMSENVTVANGTPSMTLNDGGTASYSSGSGSSALVFTYNVAAGQNTPNLEVTSFNLNGATISDGAGNAANMSSVRGNPANGLQIDTTTPVISSIVESPSSGDLGASNTVTLTLNMSEVATVNTSGGTPTLMLNDGGTAIYTGGSGTNALTFSYTVLAGQNTPDLKVSAVNLNGATIANGAGTAASLTLTGLTQTGPQIGTTGPLISSLVESPSSGDLDAGKTITLTLNMSEVATVNTTGGTPTLTLNDGGTATYTGGSGTSALTFSYTVGAAQNTAALATTAVNLNGATITDGAGNAANFSLTGLTQSGPQIDTTLPTITSLVESPSSGDLDAGKTITLTLNMSEVATVNTTGGIPTLTLNDGGTATYVSGSGTSALTFSYTVAAGQNAAVLAATSFNFNGGAIIDGAGNTANLSLSGLTQTGPEIGTLITAVAESPSSGDFSVGNTVTLTLDMSAVVTVNTTGGTPTLTLNDLGSATYVGGSVTNALTFSYTVAAGQNTAALAATSFNLNGATITDGVGEAADLSLTGLTQTGPQIDTATPTVSSVTVAHGGGNVVSGVHVTITLNMSEIVEVTGTPVLSLNDGGTATYTGGSGTSALSFSYMAAAGQNTTALQLTGAMSGGTIADAAGNTAIIAPQTLGSGVNVDQWTAASGGYWNTKADWSSPAGAPASFDLAVLNAARTYQVTSTTNQTIAELNTNSTATLEITKDSTFTITAGTGAGVQAGTVLIEKGSTLDISGAFDNTGTLWAQGGILNIDGSLTGGTTEISGAGQATLATASSENVLFQPNSAGKLVLDQATTYTGQISGFGVSQSIDLVGFNSADVQIESYVPNGSDTAGVLTITAGAETAQFNLEGAYTLANFSTSNDGNGGTLLTDPTVKVLNADTAADVAEGEILAVDAPDNGEVTFTGSTGTLWLNQPSTFTGVVSGFGAQDGIDLPGIAFDEQTTLAYSPNSNGRGGMLSVTDGAQSAQITILGHFIASSFALESDHHNGTMVVEALLVGSQSLLTHPQHA